MSMTGPYELGPIDGSASFAEVGPAGLALETSADGDCRITGAPGASPAPVTVRANPRGLVLEVRSSAPAHVNGRPVRERALLRPGDVIVVGRCGFCVRTIGGPTIPEAMAAPVRMAAEASVELPRAWLRCVAGRHAGQVRALADGDGLPWHGGPGGCEARFSIEHGRLVVRTLRPNGLIVDGHRVRVALLGGGEQLVVGGEHFVIDGLATAPTTSATVPAPVEAAARELPPEAQAGPSGEGTGGGFSPWWLIAAAVLIAVALVLLFARA